MTTSDPSQMEMLEQRKHGVTLRMAAGCRSAAAASWLNRRSQAACAGATAAAASLAAAVKADPSAHSALRLQGAHPESM